MLHLSRKIFFFINNISQQLHQLQNLNIRHPKINKNRDRLSNIQSIRYRIKRLFERIFFGNVDMQVKLIMYDLFYDDLMSIYYCVFSIQRF